MGGVLHTRDLHRDARSFAWLDDIRGDVVYAARTLSRSPGFAVVAVLTLALGIGINAAVFTVTNAVLFKGFPSVAGNDRLLYISNGRQCCASYPDFEDWRAQATSFEGMAAVRGVGVILTDTSGFPERYDATQITANTFGLLGQRALLGRDFVPADEAAGAPPVAILSYGFWERRYGKDPAVIGRTVRMNGAPTTVVGVMGQGFSFPQNQDLWVPLVPTPDLRKREARVLWFAVGRLADGVSIERARAEMDTIGKRLASAYPLTNQGQRPIVAGFHEFFIGPNAATIYGTMWAAVGFVLLIACANLANLMLARSIGRSREMAVRAALGAGRWRIVRQLLVESVMLSSVGGALGWWIAGWGVRAYAVAMAYKSPWLVVDYAMDYRVLGYVVAISIATGLLFGLAPASRLTKLDFNATLKDGGHGATRAGRGKQLSALLVIGEMALAVVLLAGAGVMVRSFLKVYTADLGINTANILTADVSLPAARYKGAEASFFDRLERRLRAMPGVESVAIASTIPTHGSLKLPYELAGAPPVDERRRPKLSALVISPGYFRTLGAAVLSGREFDDFDGPSSPPVIVVNEEFARTYWRGEDPLGRRLRLFEGTTPTPWLTVVGVVAKIVQNGIVPENGDPLVYLAYAQKPSAAMWLFARTRVPPENLANAVRRQVQALDSDLPIFGPFTLTERLDTWNYWSSGLTGALFLTFAAIALLLASVGLSAVVAHSVSQRTQEIGIRIAIGGTGRDILKLVFLQGMLPPGIGLAIGLAMSLAVTPVLKSVLVQVSPADPVTFVVAPVVLILAATLGCLIPARRAMRVDPVVVLRRN